MPQMKPLNWMILFFLFSIILTAVTMMNFFNAAYSLNMFGEPMKKFTKSHSWKW